MTLYADRVFETTLTSGTGTVTLAGAVGGRRAFSDAFNVADQVAYAISQDGTGWEVGIGTLSSVSPDLLTRDTVLTSSNAGLKVNFAAGGSVKNVFNPTPAELYRNMVLFGAGPTVRFDFDKAADLASAATVDIGAATGNSIDITGNVTITGLGTIKAGVERLTRTTGTPTFTHNAVSLILPGGVDIVAAAGDVQRWLSLGSGNWVLTGYQRASGEPGLILPGTAGQVLTSGGPGVLPAYEDTPGHLEIETALATTSGTAWDFTGIPAGARHLTINLNSVSLTGTNSLQIRLGDAGGFESSGYVGQSFKLGVLDTNWPGDAALITAGQAAVEQVSGIVEMALIDPTTNNWAFRGGPLYKGTAANVFFCCGRKALSDTLTQVRLMPSGANTGDGGSVGLQVHA